MSAGRWLKRIAIVIACALGFVVIAGATFEAVMRRRAARAFPAPGRLVDIGGRRIQLRCEGKGSPTVVLESGLDDLGSLSWVAVEDSIAATTRVCAYSRAGVMWSDPNPKPFEPEQVARDLHDALAAGGESAPWVMVGHSLGGPYIMIFTAAYPSEVKGLVFVEASHPDQLARLEKAVGKAMQPPTGLMTAGAALAWTGIVRAFPDDAPPPTWPAYVGHASHAFLPQSLDAVTKESSSLARTLQAAGRMRQLGARPLIVLTGDEQPPAAALAQAGLSAQQGMKLHAEWIAMQEDETRWSSAGRHKMVPKATHYIQFDRPDVVIASVREVVGATRAAPATP